MRPVLVLLTAAVLLATAALPARAERFIPIGARQRALGGAGVAASEDATAIDWNPANLSLLPLNRPPYGAAAKKIERAADEAKAAAEGKTQTAEPKKAAPPEGEEVEEASKWEGYDETQILVAANAELALTGDIVNRLDQLDKLIARSDIDGATQRANNGTITRQDFRNLVAFYDQVEDLDEGGDGMGEVAGGFFGRFRGVGFGFYTNTWLGLRPNTSFASGSGFSDTAGMGAIVTSIENQAGVTIPSSPTTPGGQALQAQLTPVLGGDATLAGKVAVMAEEAAAESGFDLNDPDLRDALRIAAATTGTGAGVSIENNQSGVRAQSLSTQEIALAIGIDIIPETLALGIAPKLMHGITAQKEVLVVDVLRGNEDFSNPAEEFGKNEERTLTFGVDVGATVQVSWIRLSAVGRNLNRPKFKLKGGGDFELDPQVRAGVAIRPIPSIMLTADIDVLKNDSEALPGFESRLVGGGLEWNPDWAYGGLALRAGVYGDLEDPRDEVRPVVTGGIGLKVALLTIDLAGSVSFQREEFRGREVPRDLGLAAQVGLSW